MSKPKSRRAPRARSVAPSDPAAPAPELLLEPEVMARCRMSRGQIHKLEQAERFPRRKKYGFRRVAWPTREIDEWIAIGADGWAAAHASAAAA
jgi:predicted DNA-binding transcriptional regulator AlpA